MEDIDKLLNDMEKISKQLDECLQRTQTLLAIIKGEEDIWKKKI